MIRSTQVQQDLMVRHFSRFAAPFRHQLASLQTWLAPESGQAAHSQAYGVLYQNLQQQAGLWAYVEQFRLLALISLALVPIIFLFRKAKASPEAAAMAH